MSESLEKLRKEIDVIDAKLVSLLAARLQITAKIGRLKQAEDLPPLDEDRWQQVVGRATELAEKFGVSPEQIKTIYEAIHEVVLEQHRGDH